MSKNTSSHDAITIISKKKKEVTIFIVITLVVLIVLISLPIRLMAVSVININKEVEGKRRIKETLEMKIKNLNDLNAQYQDIRDDLEDFPLVFPNQGDYSLFVSNLEEICNSNSFQLESVNVSSERNRGNDEKDFEMLNVWNSNLSVRGRRSDLIGLLESFEAMPMYPTITSLGYNNEEDENGYLIFSITLRLYGVNNSGIYLDI